MARKRLTRDESRDLTRQRLLDAAAVIIAKKGLASASVENIAERAGYTRGAFYSNFDSKTDLFIELLKRDHNDISHQLQHILDAGLSIEDTQRQLLLFYGQCYRDDSNFALWAEARLLALRDARFRARFAALCLEKRDVIAYFITQFCKLMDTPPPVPPADLAFGTMALVDGIRFFNACMPNDLPNDKAQAVLNTIFAATFFH